MAAITPDANDYEFQTLRASGPGGQHVNKVETAVILRFDIAASGLIQIKAQQFRSQEKNKQDAIDRLTELLNQATHIKKKRVATKPSRSSKLKRLTEKKKAGDKKSLRAKPNFND